MIPEIADRIDSGYVNPPFSDPTSMRESPGFSFLVLGPGVAVVA
jgi:hypothetical protein